MEDRVTRCDHSDSSQCASPRNKQILSGLTLEEPYFEKIEPLRLSPTKAKCKNVNISPNAMLVGAGFEFFSCFRAGFVRLLSEEAAENGANFGGSPQCTVEFDTSARPKPQLSSFPAPMQLQRCIKAL